MPTSSFVSVSLAIAVVGLGALPGAAAARLAFPMLTEDGAPNVQSAAAILIDRATGAVLYEKHPDAQRPIASVSKLMAALVVVEKGLRPAATQTIQRSDQRWTRQGARSRLRVGWTLSNRDLLRAALLASDNRAVLALGRSVGLDRSAFAAAMTQRARSLGLTRTRFGDPTGLDPGNVSTAREVSVMLAAALGEPLIAETLALQRATLSAAWGRAGRRRARRVAIASTNRLTRSGRWIIRGGKTGFTTPARYCLAVAARHAEREIIMVLLGAPQKLTRFGDFGRGMRWLAARPRPGALHLASAPTPLDPEDLPEGL